MNKKGTYNYFSILGALLLWMQIVVISLHQIEHQHDNAKQQKCHVCVFHSQNHFTEPDSILELPLITPTIFHEQIAVIQEKEYTSKQQEVYYLRGPPIFHI